MSKNQKQIISESAFAPAGSYDDTMPAYDWEEYTKDNVAPVSQEEISNTEHQLKEIERLYPQYHSEMIPIDKLVPAKEEWNFFPNQDKTILTDLMKNLVAYGQLSPALVWKQENGMYMILGGHTRFKAFQELYNIFTSEEHMNQELAERFSRMNCYVYDYAELTEVEARKIIIFDNIIRRDNTTAIKAQAIINMNRLELEVRDGKRQAGGTRERIMTSIAKVMNTSEGSVKRLYQLRNLIPDFWPLVDGTGEDKITANLARTFAMLPDNLQQYIYDNTLYKKKITGAALKLLSKSTTIEEVNAAYSQPSTYTVMSKTTLQEPLPDNYTSFTVVATDSEARLLKKAILSYINEHQGFESKTKQILQEILQSE